MRAMQLTGPSIDALRLVDLPQPGPGPGEALIRMRAASLNFIDIAIAAGHFPVEQFPLIPVCDGAGEIAEIGAGVDEFVVGDRVIPHAKPLWNAGPITYKGSSIMRGLNMPGSLAEFVVLP